MLTERDAFKALYDTIIRLRAPDGCPWDKEQTPASLRGDLIEETYECVEAIDEKDPTHIREELGDLFLLVTMLSYMHEQEGLFSVADALQTVTEKLIRRHPHVFGGVKVKDSAEVLDNWARIKVEQEGRKPKDSILDEVSQALPPLDRAYKLQKKAAKAGFDWPDLKGVIEKIEEELGEVTDAIAACDAAAQDAPMSHNIVLQESSLQESSLQEAIEGELGDLLFSAVNLCRYLKIEPSVALQRTNTKFVKRFKYMEGEMKKVGHEMKQENLSIMDRFWEEAKKQ
ncbi:nucleoside triphosphate pyrophosphohydrolase [Spirochaetia bacterium]|nr:nucleoside triphosphate pyrophosphohydrolase [Spirochaetia bacterium]